MASCQSTRWVSTSPYIKLTVENTSDGATSAVLTWKLYYISDSAANTSNAKSYIVKIAGSTVKDSSYDIDGKTGTNLISSGTKTITKTTAAQTISFSFSFDIGLTWSGVSKTTVSASGSISVGKKTSYTVTYNANGGSGAPSSQTKWHGTNITLSSTKPTRTGYSFQGWGISSSDTSVDYAAGATYSSNASITLYAIWKANTYTVTYNANGGSGAPGNQTKTYGVTLTLSSTKPTRSGYNFKGWGTSAGATTVSYAAGSSYTSNASITLYAIWQIGYVKPRINNLSVYRCDSSSRPSDTGTQINVSFSWATDLAVSSVKTEWKQPSSSVWQQYTHSATGTSGSVSAVVGWGVFSIDSSYDVMITVTDSSGSTSKTSSITGQVFTYDELVGGRGVAFGKPAEMNNYMDVNFHSLFRRSVNIHNDQSSSEPGIIAKRNDTGTAVGCFVGSGGTNHGVWSFPQNVWMIYGNASYTKINAADSIRLLKTTYLGDSSSVAVTSDKNLKRDIVDLDSKYSEFFDKLRPVTYKYNTKTNVGHRDHVGFIAQDVEKSLLDSGLTTEQFAGICIEKDVELDLGEDITEKYDELYSLRYEEFIALNTFMIQKAHTRIAELEARIEALEGLLTNKTEE